MATTTLAQPETIELRLRYGGGYTIRNVSTAPPRECTPAEIPVIDLANIDGDLNERTLIAEEIRRVAGELGFFYIKNHGIDEEIIQKAHDQALRFFNQKPELKELASKAQSKRPNIGWSARSSTSINAGEGLDLKEGFCWSYSPRYDPMHNSKAIPADVLANHDLDEPHIWSGTAHLERFKSDSLAYWSACITLARKLIKIFALSLSLPEDYFDHVTTFPGADAVYNFYPCLAPDQAKSPNQDVGLGSHTDFQCFTLLWQDMAGGLQVLNKDAQWIWATPIEGTFVVNIGDFLSRLTNDFYASTVHRAYNRGVENKDRISMPFFFGFNSDIQCSVIPSCVDDEHPAKYDPISVDEWRELTFSRSQAIGSKIII